MPYIPKGTDQQGRRDSGVFWPRDDIGRSAWRSPHRTHDETLPKTLHCLGSRRCAVASDCTSPATCHLLAHVEQPGAVDPVPMRLRKPSAWQRLDDWLTPQRFWRLYAAFLGACIAGVWVWRAFFASSGPL
jgi:hypothetical protein